MKGKIIKEIQYNGKIIPWIEDYFLFLNLFNADMLQFDTKRLAELFGMLDWRILPPPQNWAHINVFAPLLSLFLFNLMAKDNVVFSFPIGWRRTMLSLPFQSDSEGQCHLHLFNLMAKDNGVFSFPIWRWRTMSSSPLQSDGEGQCHL